MYLIVSPENTDTSLEEKRNLRMFTWVKEGLGNLLFPE